MKDHYPVSGAIQFMQGDKQNLRSDTLTFKPEVGKYVSVSILVKTFGLPILM